MPKIVACGAAGCGRLFAGNHGFGIHWSSEHEGDLGPGRRLRSFFGLTVDWNNRNEHARADSEEDEGNHGDNRRGVEADDGSVSSGGDESIDHSLL